MELVQTVHIVDDDKAVCDSIKLLLEATGLAARIYESAGELLANGLPPAGCVVIDVQMPGVDGLQLQACLVEQGIRLPVIMMTDHADVPVAVRAMKAGAMDFLEKPVAGNELVLAVDTALAANRRAMKATALADAAGLRLALLTARELEVLELLLQGQSSKQMARLLGTSLRTIDVHRARVFSKLEIDTLPDLVRLVQTARSIDLSDLRLC